MKAEHPTIWYRDQIYRLVRLEYRNGHYFVAMFVEDHLNGEIDLGDLTPEAAEEEVHKMFDGRRPLPGAN